MEPKSGKLHKLGFGLFGQKWHEKWVHLDGKQLKYFPISSEQPVFSLPSARQSSAVDLNDVAFVVGDEKKLNRKHVFQLVGKTTSKSSKPLTFACSSENELQEWKQAFQSRSMTPSSDTSESPVVLEKLRRAEEAFAVYDPRKSGKVDVSKLRVLLDTIGWQGTPCEFTAVQQDVDPFFQGKIARERFLSWMRTYLRSHAPVVSSAASGSAYPLVRCASLAGAIASAQANEHSKLDSFVYQPKDVAKETSDDQADSLEQQPKLRFKSQSESVLSNRPPPLGVATPLVSACAKPTTWQFTVAPGTWGDRFSELTRTEVNTAPVTPATDLADVFRHGLQVSAVVRRFREAAEDFATEVVQQLGLDDAHKLSTSLYLDDAPDDHFLATGGRAASVGNVRAAFVKYQRAGMLLYLALAQDGATETLARKVLGHQLRAARACHTALFETAAHDADSDRACEPHEDAECNACVPLQCVVDYLGYRMLVVATTASSITAHTFEDLNGSTNNRTQRISDRMRTVVDNLGLLTESLQGSQREQDEPAHSSLQWFMPLSMGMEQRSDAIVLHNLADLCPADSLGVDEDTIDAATAQRIAQVCKLRPEFVQRFGDVFPLHSAALLRVRDQESSGAGPTELERRFLRRAAHAASDHLRIVAVPEFVQQFECDDRNDADPAILVAAMHRAGINARYLGLCFECATRRHTRRLILTAMLARACKQDLDHVLRTITRESAPSLLRDVRTLAATGDAAMALTDSGSVRATRVLMLGDAKRALVAFCNLVFGAGSPHAKAFWTEHILPLVAHTFALPMALEWTLDTLLADELVHLPQLWAALQAHINLVMVTTDMPIDFNIPEPFSVDQIEALLPRTRLLARTSLRCLRLLDDVDLQDEIGLRRVLFEVAIADTSLASTDQRPVSRLLSQAAELALELGRVEEADKLARLALDEGDVAGSANAVYAHLVLMRTCSLRRDYAAVGEHFALAVSTAQWALGTAHPLVVRVFELMVDMSVAMDEWSLAVQHMDKCVGTVRDCYGRLSIRYAMTRQQQGDLLLQTGDREGALGVLDDALTVYDQLADQETEHDIVETKLAAATCCYAMAQVHVELSQAVGPQGDAQALESAYRLALRAYTLRKETCESMDECVLQSMLQLGELFRALGDSYRAIEFFKPALAWLKTLQTSTDDQETVDAVRQLTQRVLQLHVQTALSPEHQGVIEKTRKVHSALIGRLTSVFHEPLESPCVTARNGADQEVALAGLVVRKLYHQNPTEFLDALLSACRRELDEQKQLQSLAGMPPTSAATSPLSRFASFANTSASSGLSSVAGRTSSFQRPALDHLEQLQIHGGEFTSLSQLAGVLAFMALLA
ncbi:TPA: hypothetical protein N0F65_006194 [Lagenidium giganteum]|uniref:PH domain-containing protein n=1 Tax=Lagenidium giganteum TaxID=4803 RepID=A0AAV2Z8I7_9STRA|nr:TPA: hypothetical protein N0F65_006194 [Lagenidium giganteum]